MGKTGKWLKNILTGKRDNNVNKEKEKPFQHNDESQSPATTPISIPTPKEKRRWSFRRSSDAPKDAAEQVVSRTTPPPPQVMQAAFDAEAEHKKHAMAVAAATAAAADAAVAAAQAAAAVIRLTAAANGKTAVSFLSTEDAAAVRIQSVFRSYLARKALCALKGLVKLQALVRGHLVRKQATATLRCMQALVTAQARARVQRLRAADDAKLGVMVNHRTSTHRKSVQDNWLRTPYHEFEMGNLEENIKIVEMDMNATKATINNTTTKSRNSYSNSTIHPQPDRADHKLSTHHHYPPLARPPSSAGKQQQQDTTTTNSKCTTLVTDMSPRAHSGHFEDYSFGTAQSSPGHYCAAAEPLPYDFPLFPNYMANTLSSRAKSRSQSAPKQRPADAFERQPSSGGRRRASMEGRRVPPRAMRMQRSSSHVGAAAQNYQYPWSMVRLDRSSASLKDSECGSSSTVLTNTNYCRSLVGFDLSTIH